MTNANKIWIVAVGASAVLAVSMFGASNSVSLNAINYQNYSYGHYTAVLPGFSTPGCREYWVCCETHEILFEKPFEGIIYSNGAPTAEMIASMESLNDGRYLAPIVKTDAKHFQYGVYPQTHVSDSSLISALNALSSRGPSGYYEYEGGLYEKSQAVPYLDSYRFDDGTSIADGTSYWYECNPIEWKILSSENDEYFVISEKLLDMVVYSSSIESLAERTDYEGNVATVYPNNYKYSDIRTFLNVNFYNRAFHGGNLNIQRTEVDNSVSTAYGKTNPYVCDNTNDKVFLLSYADVRNPSYFSVIENRCSITSDFARASGAFLTENVKHPNCASYFTRSPGTEDEFSVMQVDGEGEVNPYYTGDDEVALRPAMKLTIAE